MRGSSTGDPASHRTQDKRSHPASGAQAGTGRNALRPETVAEMRGASEKRPRSCSVGGSESSETWDNGISLERSLNRLSSASLLSVEERITKTLSADNTLYRPCRSKSITR